jgi:DNA gyrase subunit A
VRGIRLKDDDRVVAMDIARPDGFLLTVSTKGYGKLTPIIRYPRQHRAGVGVKTFRIIQKTGDLVAARVVALTYQVMLISADGIIIYTPVKEKDPTQGIAVHGRSTQGVRLMRLDGEDRVVAVAAFEKAEKGG